MQPCTSLLTGDATSAVAISSPPDESLAAASSPLQRLIEEEEIQTVLDLMADLPTAGVELLTMRYLQQDSYETIGHQLGKTAHQAPRLCHKALIQLRDLAREKQRVDLERGQS